MRASAGVLLFRRASDATESFDVLLGHMGGPFWERREEGAWTIPKGELAEGEDPADAARRELTEELGVVLDDAQWAQRIDLGEHRQSRKVVRVFAVEHDLDPASVSPAAAGRLTVEWPPRSGRTVEFAELDRAAWFGPDQARRLVVRGQATAVDQLERALDEGAGGAGPGRPVVSPAR